MLKEKITASESIRGGQRDDREEARYDVEIKAKVPLEALQTGDG